MGGQSDFLAFRSRRISARSRSGEQGLVRTASHPAINARSRSKPLVQPVTAMTGIVSVSVRLQCARSFERVRYCASRRHPKSRLPQHHLDHLARIRIVIDDEHMGRVGMNRVAHHGHCALRRVRCGTARVAASTAKRMRGLRLTIGHGNRPMCFPGLPTGEQCGTQRDP